MGITPLASTLLLMLVSGRAFTWSIAAAAALITGAALLGTRQPQPPSKAAGSSASTT
ncbi:hypothetical protein GCM10027034_34820 [Ramlibacter solisilvae]|uniref:hypothetical protein n=1 Tax=Ramlibacter tataouinensis TaxID=94132 RepID=UPI001314B13C|nr:hypothetical protein [Ramlibacter tataouinensis]